MISRDALCLTESGFDRVRRDLALEIRSGLSEHNQPVAALPTYLAAPKSLGSGPCIVMDCGGTNLRAAIVDIDARGRPQIARGPVQALLPDSNDGASKDRFFDAHVNLVMQLQPPSEVPLAYCFSYPSQNESSGDARLLKWTKGLAFEGVVGTLVGEALAQALLARGIKISDVRVLNDTVASLFAGTTDTEGSSIGLIVGTGFNMATYAPGRLIPKCEEWPDEKMMALNLESGNFRLPLRTSVDEEVDQASSCPGEQAYEKAVSGLYLPKLFNVLCPEADTLINAESLITLRDLESKSEQGKWAKLILERSADLVAAGLAAVVDVTSGERADDGLSPWPVEICAEGGLFWGDPQYATRVSERLSLSLGPSYSVDIRRKDSANIFGAALAALAEKR